MKNLKFISHTGFFVRQEYKWYCTGCCLLKDTNDIVHDLFTFRAFPYYSLNQITCFGIARSVWIFCTLYLWYCYKCIRINCMTFLHFRICKNILKITWVYGWIISLRYSVTRIYMTCFYIVGPTRYFEDNMGIWMNHFLTLLSYPYLYDMFLHCRTYQNILKITWVYGWIIS